MQTSSFIFGAVRFIGPRCALVGGAALIVAGCTYDFDAPFSETPATSSVGGGAGAGVDGGGGTTSSGGTTSTGGTSSGGAAGGDGGSGAQAGGENCINGTDDDGDQLADCADPECQPDWECAVTPDAAWAGPFTYHQRDGGAALPSCAAFWQGHTDYDVGALSVPDAQCNGCTCGTPNLQCGLASTEVFTGSSCSGLDQTLTPSSADVCLQFNGTDVDSFNGLTGAVLDASCQPAGGGVSALPPAIPLQQGRACEGTLLGGGCSGQQVCAPRSTSQAPLCIVQAGDLPCVAPYSNKTLVHAGRSESRDCTACSCDPATSVQCWGATEIFTNGSCSGVPAATVSNDGIGCDHPHLTNVPDGSFLYTPTIPSSGPCPPVGGTPTGTVTQTDETTICCR
jgi:hypothetical protein